MKPDYDHDRVITMTEGQLNKIVSGGLKSSQDAHGQVPNIESARKRIMHQIRARWLYDKDANSLRYGKIGGYMMNWLFKKLESRINGLITRRILLFHDALVCRGQIPEAPSAPNPVVENPAQPRQSADEKGQTQ